jgi:hypothetical protein
MCFVKSFEQRCAFGGKADLARPAARSAYDAVDGARSAASKCYRDAAILSTHLDDPPRSRCSWQSWRQAGSAKPMACWPCINLMQYLRILPIACVLFGACSCSELAGDSGVSKPAQIRCQVGPDCDLKWERAYTWVVESSGLKLKTKTDGLIKTAETPGNDRTLVVTITKNASSQSGIYEIDFIGKCTSIWSCIPSDAESRTNFANFVSTAN